MCDATGLSQRRACRLTALSLSTCRYEAQRPAADAHLSGRITELALERRRFGYRRIWQLLRREGLHVNHKRVYRIYHLNGLSVKRRRRRKGLATERFPLLRPDAPNLTWSMDFVMDALANGRRIKCLTCVDDFTKECLNEHWFSDILHVRKTINDWRQDYNERRPHSSLHYQTPAEFATDLRNRKYEEKPTDITN